MWLFCSHFKLYLEFCSLFDSFYIKILWIVFLSSFFDYALNFFFQKQKSIQFFEKYFLTIGVKTITGTTYRSLHGLAEIKI